MSDTDTILEEMEEALADKEATREDRGVEQPKGMRLKQKTNIEFGGEEVAGRTRAWRTADGYEVWLNTAELPYHLAKRRPNGQRVFSLRKQDAPELPPIIPGLKCAICERLNDSSAGNQFRTEASYHDHMEILHPREYQRMLRDEEMAQRSRQTDALIALATRGAPNGTEAVEQPEEEGGNWVCPTCFKGNKSKAGLLAHQRTHA